MTDIILMCVTVFATQIVFIGARTLNVKAIADQNIPSVLLTGTVIHLSWLLSIAIGSVSMYELMTNFDLTYIPVIICSLAGGLLGSYWGMKRKNKKQS